jgi:hypothetical protein
MSCCNFRIRMQALFLLKKPATYEIRVSVSKKMWQQCDSEIALTYSSTSAAATACVVGRAVPRMRSQIFKNEFSLRDELPNVSQFEHYWSKVGDDHSRCAQAMAPVGTFKYFMAACYKNERLCCLEERAHACAHLKSLQQRK